MANALPPINTTTQSLVPPASPKMHRRHNSDPTLSLFANTQESSPSRSVSSLSGRVSKPPEFQSIQEDEAPELDLSVQIERYREKVETLLKKMSDPLKQALFLINEYEKQKDTYLRSSLEDLIKFICDSRFFKEEEALISKQALPIAKQLLQESCSDGAFFPPQTRLKKWIVLQSLILTRQIQLMALTAGEIDSTVLLNQMKKIIFFISSLPEDLKSLFNKNKEVDVVTIKRIILNHLTHFLFSKDPLPNSLDQKKTPIEDCFVALRDFLNTDQALICLKAKGPKGPSIRTLPVISSVSPQPIYKDVSPPKLEKALNQLKNETISMPLRLIALCRFACYSSGVIDKTTVPTALLGKLDYATGRALFPNELQAPAYLFRIVGQKCRHNINKQKSLCVQGSIVAIGEEIQSYVLEANQTILSLPDRETQKVENFHHFHFLNQLLLGLLDLQHELFTGPITQTTQTLDEVLHFVLHTIMDILDLNLNKELGPYLARWDHLIRADKAQLETLEGTANYLVYFYKYFLLKRLIAICKIQESEEEPCSDLLVRMLTQFSEKDRFELLKGLSEDPVSKFWSATRKDPQKRQLLCFCARSIKENAQALIKTLKDATKA